MSSNMHKLMFLPVIAGPTASGKTALAVEMALRFGGEVVSADSMQVYDTLTIGTARPTADEMRGVPHHLLGFVPLSDRYNVAQYVVDAHAAVRAVCERGNLPILCGGTGLYMDAVTDNLTFSGDGGDAAMRKSLRDRAAAEGGEALLAELAEVDPDTAARLHPSDTGRIVRALELFRTSGITMSRHAELSRSEPSPYDPCRIVLSCRDRAVIYDRIDQRVDAMLAAGLEVEARTVLATEHAPTAMQAIGYKELAPAVSGDILMEQAVENLKRATRRYAKRQMSWFRRYAGTHVLYIDDYVSAGDLFDAAEDVIRGSGQIVQNSMSS